jgi:hypothetical protein
MKHNSVPDILVEQYVLGELPEEQAREIERSEGFAERVAEIERSNQEFLDAYPPAEYANRIQNQFEAEEARESSARAARTQKSGGRRRSVRWLAIAPAGAAVAVLAAILVVQSLGPASPGSGSGPDDLVRLKGLGPALSVYRSVDGPATRDDDAEALEDGARAQAGDRLQLAYNAGDRPYGAIISVDGRGVVTLHYPLTASAEPVLEVGREQRLPYGYQLDDAPDFERFYFVTSQQPFSVGELIRSVRAQSANITERTDYSLVLSDVFDDEYEVVSVTIDKGE